MFSSSAFSGNGGLHEKLCVVSNCETETETVVEQLYLESRDASVMECIVVPHCRHPGDL